MTIGIRDDRPRSAPALPRLGDRGVDRRARARGRRAARANRRGGVREVGTEHEPRGSGARIHAWVRHGAARRGRARRLPPASKHREVADQIGRLCEHVLVFDISSRSRSYADTATAFARTWVLGRRGARRPREATASARRYSDPTTPWHRAATTPLRPGAPGLVPVARDTHESVMAWDSGRMRGSAARCRRSRRLVRSAGRRERPRVSSVLAGRRTVVARLASPRCAGLDFNVRHARGARVWQPREERDSGRGDGGEGSAGRMPSLG